MDRDHSLLGGIIVREGMVFAVTIRGRKFGNPGHKTQFL